MTKEIKLRAMRVGQKGIIRKIMASGEINQRIRDMGLIPGASVAVVGKAPLKDPVALRIADFTIALRNREADFITVDIPVAEDTGLQGKDLAVPLIQCQSAGV